MAKSRKSQEGMDELIQSIQEQTLRLKVTQRQQNLSKSSRPSDSSASSKEAKTLPRSPFAQSVQLPPAEYHYSRTLIESLLRDNKAFHCEIDDYKQVLSAVVAKCRQAQKELEIERVRSEQLQLLEDQLERERQKTKHALEETAFIRERYLQVLEVTRQSVFELSEQDKEEQVLTEYLSRENQHLREMLGIARLSEDKQTEIETALAQEEATLREGDPGDVKAYRQRRLHRKKSSFLIAPGAPKDQKAEASNEQQEEPK